MVNMKSYLTIEEKEYQVQNVFYSHLMEIKQQLS